MTFIRPIVCVLRIGLAALAALLVLTGCGTPIATAGGAGIDFSARTIRIVTTTGHVADVVRNVGGQRVTVTALMGPGVDPHLYKASAGDVMTIQNADAVFYSGLHLEGRMIEIFERLARTKPTYAVTDGIPAEKLRTPPEFEGSYDPHVWFDPTLWSYTADTVAQRLSELDPKSAQLYRDNAARYKQELARLDAYAQERLGTIPPESRVLITAHDAFGYFGVRYGLEVRGLQGISTASEAGAADVQTLAEFIASRKIRAIFIESSVPQATIEAVQAAVRSRGHQVAIGGQLFSDALGEAGTPEGTYNGMFRANVDTISKALAPQP
ncbi:MAG TPA: zinc ABC transporter substrate-binding protein [Herpetosiphonaceae bacterium]